jgi:GNAT superfamily N-acetyltransferase
MNSIITTYLEMTDVGQFRPKTCADTRFQIRQATVNQWRFNRFLYELVGEDWAWRDKLSWSDEQWRSYVEDENVRTFVACYDGSVAGYFELFKRDNEVEIVYLGLVQAFIGRGYGAAILTRAIEEAWKMKPKRVWLHTCDLDHMSALNNYTARGMTVYKTETT